MNEIINTEFKIMKNTKENAQIILSKYCGLTDESIMGEAVLKAMVDYAKKVSKYLDKNKHEIFNSCNITHTK